MKKHLSRKALVGLCALLLLIVLIVWTVWGNTALMVSTITVSNSRVPSDFSGFRIAQVSDLHNAEFGEGNIRGHAGRYCNHWRLGGFTAYGH